MKREDFALDFQLEALNAAASQPKKCEFVVSKHYFVSLARNSVFLESSNADMDELPDVIRQLLLMPQTPQENAVPSSSFFSAMPEVGSSCQVSHFGTADLLSVQFQFSNLCCVAMPPDFVEPQPSDIILLLQHTT